MNKKRASVSNRDPASCLHISPSRTLISATGEVLRNVIEHFISPWSLRLFLIIAHIRHRPFSKLIQVYIHIGADCTCCLNDWQTYLSNNGSHFNIRIYETPDIVNRYKCINCQDTKLKKILLLQ